MQDVQSTASGDTQEFPALPVNKLDIGILVWVGVGTMSILVIFGAAIFWSGLISFPEMSGAGKEKDFYLDTLIYRERRMYLALIFRTFLTGFSFVVGLALCTMGGMFILRQVKALTEISGSFGGMTALLGDETAQGDTSGLRDTQFAFKSYSPGVFFMVGGILIMAITQMLAIEIKALEIVPPRSQVWCLDAETGGHVICQQGGGFQETNEGQTTEQSDNAAGSKPIKAGSPFDHCDDPETRDVACDFHQKEEETGHD